MSRDLANAAPPVSEAAVPPPAAAPTALLSLGGCVWAAAAVLIVAIVAATWLLWAAAGVAREAAGEVAQTPVRVADALAGAFKPTVNVTTVVQGSLVALHARPKLVVLTPEFDVAIHKSSQTTTLWGYVSFGTTSVTLRAPGNRVQYYVPLERITRENFHYDEARHALVVRVPPPVLDSQIVEVQSDPSRIEVHTHNGWAKLDRYSGSPLREEARRELRTAVLRTGASAHFQSEARRRAEEEVRKLFAPLSESLREGVMLEVEIQ